MRKENFRAVVYKSIADSKTKTYPTGERFVAHPLDFAASVAQGNTPEIAIERMKRQIIMHLHQEEMEYVVAESEVQDLYLLAKDRPSVNIENFYQDKNTTYSLTIIDRTDAKSPIEAMLAREDT